jgi:hypothetical protein
MDRVEDLRSRTDRILRQLADRRAGSSDRPYFELLVELVLDVAARVERVEMKLDGICPGCNAKPVKIV